MACAQPNYDDPNGQQPRTPATDDKLSACDVAFAQSQLCADLKWERRPTEQDMGSFVLEFHNPDDSSQFVDLTQNLDVKLWMPSMGHGSSPVKIEKVGPGQYRVSEVFFVMRGDWEIQFKLENGSTVVEQTSLSYRF